MTDRLPIVVEAKRLFGFWRGNDVVAHGPRIQQIESTNHCNMVCPMCPHSDMRRPKGRMDLALYERILDQIPADNGAVGLHHFGEVLLHPQVEQLIEKAADRGIEIGLSTNVLRLTEAVSRKLLDAGLKWIVLDLDSMDPELYARVRPPAKVDVIMDNIRKFLDLKREYGSGEPHVTLQMIRFDENESEFEEYRKHWECEEINDITYVRYNTYDVNVKEIDSLVRKKKQRQESSGKCVYPWRSMTVLWDGRVVPCCGDYEGKLVLGDLKEQTLEEIWNGAKMRTLRRQHAEGRAHEEPLCRDCKSAFELTPTSLVEAAWSRAKRALETHRASRRASAKRAG